ncbi:MAG: PorT family protein [Bacteroidetes bacterium]|nr:PorT family protein [Bacteroidota bacterium]MBS1648797.1 PorT family protein [Bacteroidota bacterium]
MKKIIILSSIILGIGITGFSQGFHIGAKVGANANKINGQSFNNGFNLGYQLGGFAEIDFSKTIGIQPEVLFSQSQTTTTNFNSNLTPNSNADFNYLSIPILLRINTGKLVTLHVGPQYSILVSNSKTFVQNGSDAFKNGDFAMVAGLQLNLGSLRVYGRYNIGLSNLNDIDNKEQWKSQQIQVGLGLKIF